MQIAVTLRSLGRVMPSMWQQNIQSGAVGELDTWLRQMLERPPDKPPAPFWTLHRHDELIARWADVVGVDRVTVVVVDDARPRLRPAGLRAAARACATGRSRPTGTWPTGR